MLSTDSDKGATAVLRPGATALARNDAATYVALQQSAVYIRLRSRSRRYLMAMTVMTLCAFSIPVLLVGWSPAVYAMRVAGNVDLGMLFAVGLILLPALVAVVHRRYAGRRLDPLAQRIREDFESSRQ